MIIYREYEGVDIPGRFKIWPGSNIIMKGCTSGKRSRLEVSANCSIWIMDHIGDIFISNPHSSRIWIGNIEGEIRYEDG